MRVDVTMPQMGESIAEGTITRWIKQVGDTVERDEPIFEISTDKVDAEIPSPRPGCWWRSAARKARRRGQRDRRGDRDRRRTRRDGRRRSARRDPAAAEGDAARRRSRRRRAQRLRRPRRHRRADATAQLRLAGGAHDRRRARHRPARVPGTGAGGRVTKKDILAFIDAGWRRPPPRLPPPATPSVGSARCRDRAAGARPSRPASRLCACRCRVMRKKIAEHMIESRRTSAHVHSVFEVDMTRIVATAREAQAEPTSTGTAPS